MVISQHFFFLPLRESTRTGRIQEGEIRDTETSMMPVHEYGLSVVCCQAEACLISPSFTYKGGRNAKAGKIAGVRSLSRNNMPYVERLLVEALEGVVYVLV
jgi:hypothetical protein